MLSCFLFGQIFYIKKFQISIVSCDFKKRKNNTVTFYGRLRDVIRKYGADFLLTRVPYISCLSATFKCFLFSQKIAKIDVFHDEIWHFPKMSSFCLYSSINDLSPYLHSGLSFAYFYRFVVGNLTLYSHSGYERACGRWEAPPDMRACSREYILKGGHPTLNENCRTEVIVE